MVTPLIALSPRASLHLVPPVAPSPLPATDFSKLVSPLSRQATTETADIVILLSDPDTYRAHHVGRYDKTKHATVKIPDVSDCISSPIQHIGSRCTRGGSFNTISNLACRMGLKAIDAWPETDSAREVGRALRTRLPDLKAYEDALANRIHSNLAFQLPGGKERWVNITLDVHDVLKALAGALGVSQGVLLAVAVVDTLRRQPEAYVSQDHRVYLTDTLRNFRGWLGMKAAAVRACLEFKETLDEEGDEG